jgi:hypothetical protein
VANGAPSSAAAVAEVLLRVRLARGRRGGTGSLNAGGFFFDGLDASGRFGGIVLQAGSELFGAHPPVEQARGSREQGIEADTEALGVNANAAQSRVLGVGIARLAIQCAEDGVQLKLAEVGHGWRPFGAWAPRRSRRCYHPKPGRRMPVRG